MNSNILFYQEVFPTPVTRCGVWKRQLTDYFSCGDTISPLGTEDSVAIHKDGFVSTAADVYDDGMAEGDDISKFLYRPIKVAVQEWAPGLPFTPLTITPLTSYLADPVIQSKLAYYKLIKCDFEVLIMTKGTKFHAGVLLASLIPIGVDWSFVTIGGDTQLITRSQRVHVDIEVGESQSGVITVPFVSPFNFHDRTNPENTLSPSRYGRVVIDSYVNLRGVNTTDNVSVAVFIKARNVKLASPTFVAAGGPLDMWACGKKKKNTQHVVKMSGMPKRDEFQKPGPVSEMSNAVADAAGYLTEIPVIGPFATAAQIGARAMSQIATMFGYSRPAMIDNTSPVKNRPVGSLALVDAQDTSQKMTYTSKQELSVDPTTVGWHDQDELNLEYLTRVESYFAQFEWLPTDPVGSHLFRCRVTPMVERVLSIPLGIRRVPTALSFASRPFAYWSGTLEYRISLVGTAFHNGKLAVFYSPVGSNASDIDYTTCFHFMVDISETRDVRFSIAWKQARPYAAVVNGLTQDTFYAPTLNPALTYGVVDNGCWYVRVVNELVVSDGTTPVTVLVRIRAGDDFELRGTAAENLSKLTFYASGGPRDFWACSGELDGSEAPVDSFAKEPEQYKSLAPSDSSFVDIKSLAFYGERLVSMRSLLKRYVFYRESMLPSSTTLGSFDHVTMQSFPLYPGGNANGVDSAVGPVPYNYVGLTYINYMALSYGMWRGSVRYKFLTLGGSVPSQSTCEIQMAHSNLTTGLSNYDYVTQSIATTNDAAARGGAVAYGGMMNGVVLERNQTVDSLEVEVPYLVPLRASLVGYEPNRAATNTFAEGICGGNKFVQRTFLPPTNPLVQHAYCAAGDDFTFMIFQGAAPCIMLDNVPALPP